MRILTLGAAGIAAFVTIFLVALHVHFPGDAARDRIAWELQEWSGGTWLIQASDARLYRVSGLALEDVVLFQRDKPKRRQADEDVVAVPILRAEDVALRARLLPLLRGHQSAAFAVDLYGGELDGDVTLTDSTQQLRIDGADIDLSRVPLEGEDWMVDATGLLRLVGDVTLDVGDVGKSAGDLEIEISDLVFQQATIMGMTLEPTPFSEAVLVFDVEKGRAQVTKGRITSEPVDITIGGEIVLNKVLERSRLKLELEVRFSDQFDRLARMAPDLKAARDTDGVYHFKVTGTLKSPRFREERQSRSTSRPSPASGLGTALDDGGDDDAKGEGDDAAAARRADRRERIRDRRKRMMDRQENRADFDEPGMPPLPGQLTDPIDGGDLPRTIDRQRFRDREEVLDVNIGGELDGDPIDDFEDELPMDDDDQFDDELPGDDEF